MTPFYLNPPSVPFVGGDQSQDHLPLTPTSQTTSSSYHIFFSPSEDQGQGDHVTDQKPQQLHRHEDNDEQFWTGKASDHDFHVSPFFPIVDRNDCDGIKASICKHDDHGLCDNGPPRWMSSKMRLMRKMMNSNRMVENKLTSGAQTSQSGPRSSSCDDDNNNNGNSNMLNSTIRVCSDCKTTKTPLWRSGPQGPKSLCNACGIRQRKARRAMAAAATGGVMATQPSSMANKVPKEKQINCNNQFKKRCKLSSPSANKKLLFDDFTISLSKNSAFHRVFPQDEKEAAILLMALSYGLVNS